MKKQYFILFIIFASIISHINFANASVKKQIRPTHSVKGRVANVKSLSKRTITAYIPPVQTMLVVDLQNGKILNSYNPTTKIHPASLVKLMTLYLAFEAIKNNKLDFNHKIPISRYAASMEPCKMGLKVGDYIPVKHAIASLVVKSHNDNAAAIAERIAGSERNFSLLMNKTAKKLKMHDTQFHNASGLHNDCQVTTAYDLVKLVMAIRRDHPNLYPLLSQTSFEYRGRRYDTHNKVLKSYEYAKAGKTGFTKRSGFNLIAHAGHRNKDIVAVLTGFRTSCERDRTMVALLDQHLGVQTDHSPFIRRTHTPKYQIIRVSSTQQITRKKIVKKKLRT